MKTEILTETLRERWDRLDETIENYVPPTPWEAANQRYLKRLKEYRREARKAVERHEQETKRRMIRERRSQTM